MAENDLLLLQRFADSGDAEAFSEIVGRYQSFVYAACLRVLGNAADAEDMAQECFLRLTRRPDSVRSSVAGWLHRNATTMSIDEKRRQTARKRREEVHSQMNSSDSHDPTWQKIGPHVDQALNELPDELRLVLVEHFLRRRAQAELAKELGISKATMSRRVDAGIGELRKKLKEAGLIVSAVALATLVTENAVCAAPASLTAALGKMAMAGAMKTSAAPATAAASWVGKGTVAGAMTAAAKVKIAAVVAAAALAAGGIVAHKVAGKPAGDPVTAEPEQPEAAGRQAWITVLARSPIRSINEYVLTYRACALVDDKLEIRSSELEFRSADNKRQVARLRDVMAPPADLADEKRFPAGTFGVMELNRRQRRLIGNLPDGDYLVAVNTNGLRCSNVARLKIDAAFDAKKEPTVRAVPLPLGPGQDLRYVGLVVTGPEPMDPELTNMAAAFPELVVDSVERRLRGMHSTGPVAPLQPGQRHQTIIDLAHYKPDIAPKAQHTIKARVLAYESAVVTIPAKDSLGKAWDEATAHIEKLPPDVVVLRGMVTNPDGGPAAGYEVCLGGAKGNFRERCNGEGRYELVRVPAGEYRLSANPPGKGQPEIVIKSVRIEAGETLLQDMSLERKFSFSGKTMYDDGTPAFGQEVMTTWTTPDGRAEFNDFAVVRADGRYMVGAPFEVATFVQGPGRDVQRNVQAGRDDVDFIMERPWGKANLGVQCRLRAEKTVWRVGEVPKLKAEVRNRGRRKLFITPLQEACKLQLDGSWHVSMIELEMIFLPFGPGRHYDAIPVVLGESWYNSKERKTLKLTPGKHTVRVAFEAEPVGEDAGKPVRVVSNPVEIEIVPAERPGAGADLD